MYPGYRVIEKTILANINRLVHLLIEMSAKDSAEKEPYLKEAATLIRELRPLLLHLVEGKEEHLEPLIRQLVMQKLPHHRILGSFGNLQKDLSDILSYSLGPENIEHINPPVETFEEVSNADQDPAEENSEDYPQELCEEGLEDITNEENTESPPETPVPAEPVSEDDLSPPDEQAQQTLYRDSITPPDEWAPEDSPLEEDLSDQHPPTLENLVMKIFAGENIIKDYVWRSLIVDYFLPEKKIAIICTKSNYRQHKLYEVLLKKDQIKIIKIQPEDLNNIRLLTRKLTKL